jgi:prophage regulatory protein
MLHNRLFSAPKPPVVLPESGYIRLPLVLAYTGLSKSTWYAGVKDGIYPRQHKIGRRAVGWDVDDIRIWKQANKAAS